MFSILVLVEVCEYKGEGLKTVIDINRKENRRKHNYIKNIHIVLSDTIAN